MKAFKLLSLLFALLISQSAISSTIYLEYDAACMDRYEYRYSNAAAGFSHVVYHVRLNDQQKVIFEVGIENRVNQRARPSDVKSCKDLAMNERFARQVNKGEIQLYFVRRNGNEYNVSPVGLASYAQITPSLIGYSSLDHVFAYNFNQAANGKNIATSGSQAKVYYNGTVSYDCPKKYQFTKIRNRAGKNYAELVLIPEIGMVEEKTGFNQTDAENNKMELVSINHIPLDKYLEGFCQGKELNYRPQGVFYSTRAASTSTSTSGGTVTRLESGKPITTTKPTPSTTGTSTTTAAGTISTAPKCNVYKDIDRGLYIDWSTGQPANTTCGGNTFRSGMLVGYPVVNTTPTPAPPSTTTYPTPPAYPTPAPVPPTAYSRCKEYPSPGYHIVQKSETLYGIARLYGVSYKDIIKMNSIKNPNKITPCSKLKIRHVSAAPPIAETADPEDWKGSGATHVVSRGETIYQLAKKYGYSVGRFRSMNNLSISDPIYVGQVLKTNDCNCPAPVMASRAPSPASIPVPSEYGTTGGRINTQGTATTTGSKRKVHIVKENETVFTISKTYGISVSRLRTLNKLEENEIIYPFQRLYIN